MRSGVLSIAVLVVVGGGFISAGQAQDLKLLFDSLRQPSGQEIRILDALYGQDQQVCRAYDAVAQLCDGRDYCEIEADSRLCGDPYANVRKQLFIGYDCGDGRRSISVDEGEVARVYCIGAGGDRGDVYRGQPGAGPPQGWQRGALYVDSVRYGADGRYCDATQPFVFACNGQPRCSIRIDNRLCGDPIKGMAKAAVIRHWCNGQLREGTVKERKTAQLSCY